LKKRIALFFILIIVTVFLAACNEKGNIENDRYYLTIGADNVKSIGVSTQNKSGGCENADGSMFKEGDCIWLESLDGYHDLRGVTITALDENGTIIWSTSIPDKEKNAGITHLTQDRWIITNTK